MIDIFRLFFAYCVVAMHVSFFENESLSKSIISTTIFEIAVPFFFIVSSFLFFKKCGEKEYAFSYFLKHEKRLILLYAFWSLCYLPASLISSFNGSFDNVSIKTLAAELLHYLKLFIFDSTYIHLWYLNTLIVCLAILFYLRKHISSKAILIISAIICIVLSFVSEHRESTIGILYYRFIPYILRNTLRKGLFTCSIGLFISDTLKSKKPYVFLALIALISGIEIFFIIFKGTATEYINCFVSYALSSIKAGCLVMVCLGISLKDSPAYKIIRALSSLIYFSHMLFGSIVSAAANSKPFACLPQNPCQYVICAVLTTAVSLIVYQLSYTKKLHFLRNIY